MKESYFYKNYFNLLNSNTYLGALPKNSLINIKLSFSSNKDVKVARLLVDEINGKFNKKLIILTFLANSAFSFSDNTSSFNFVLSSKNNLAILLFFDLLFKLNIFFSIVSFDSNLNFFSVNFFKAFEKNKLALSFSKENFIKNFSQSFLFYIKKIEFYNSIRFLKLLKHLNSNRS